MSGGMRGKLVSDAGSSLQTLTSSPPDPVGQKNGRINHVILML